MGPLRLSILISVCAASCCPARGEGPAASPSEVSTATSADDRLAATAWLAGTWITTEASEDSFTKERWSLPDAGKMTGSAVTFVDGKITHQETLRIEASETGAVVYHADPSGQVATAFTLTQSDAERLVFENPEHDFPKRIVYRRRGPAELEVRIEGDEDGAPKEATWIMRRVDAP